MDKSEQNKRYWEEAAKHAISPMEYAIFKVEKLRLELRIACKELEQLEAAKRAKELRQEYLDKNYTRIPTVRREDNDE